MIDMISMRPVHLRSVDLNLLTVLQALLEERHITRAAQRLNMSQPAVSRALSRLRHLFNDPLLVRTGHKMVPTSRAKSLEAQVARILSDVSGMLAPANFDPKLSSSRFRIVATEGAIIAVLAEGLSELVVQAPAMEFQISDDMTDVYSRLELGEAELAIDVFPDLPSRAFHQQALFSNRLVCVTRRSPRRRRAVTIEG
jgi:DNA-binding transcriptional LysR family regulator